MLLTIILGVYGELKTRTNVCLALYVYITKMKKWYRYIITTFNHYVKMLLKIHNRINDIHVVYTYSIATVIVILYLFNDVVRY